MVMAKGDPIISILEKIERVKNFKDAYKFSQHLGPYLHGEERRGGINEYGNVGEELEQI